MGPLRNLSVLLYRAFASKRNTSVALAVIITLLWLLTYETMSHR